MRSGASQSPWHRPRRWLRVTWRWSWTVTLPLTALFLLWLQATYSRYEDFGLRYKVFRDSESLLREIGTMEFEHALRRLELIAPAVSAPGTGDVRRVELFIDETSREQLLSNLPHSGRHEVKAALRYPDGDIHKVSIKYRGDFHWHWSGFKKSLRVKAKKKHLFDGMRSFNLIAPKFEGQIHNEISYRLASRLGLVVPRHEMVNVWINGVNRGLYLLAEQLGESTLRHNRRMPGDLYKGELVGRERYNGIRNDLFLHPRLWQKIAVNNHYPEDSYIPLETLIGALLPESGDPGALAELLDVEIWGKFLAFELLTQTTHYDRSHNWRLYYDPARSVFEPVIWDPTGWAPAWLPKGKGKAQADLLPSPLHQRLLTRPEFLQARHRAIEDFFAGDDEEQFFAEVDQVIDLASRVVQRDPDLARDFRVLSPGETVASMHGLKRSIRRVFQDIQESYLEASSTVFFRLADDPSHIELRIHGRRPPTELRLEFAQPPNPPPRAALGQIIGDETAQIDISGAVSLHGSSIRVALPLFPKFAAADTGFVSKMSKYLRVEAGEYQLFLAGLTEADRLIAFTALYGPDDSKPARRVREWKEVSAWPADRLPLPRPAVTTEIWRQDKLIDGLVTVEKNLIIQPGTVVRLTEGSSLVVEGQLRAEGLPDRPIQFLPATANQDPWGAVVIRGRAADGSSLRHVEMGYGSGHKTDLAEYSGMLSIHEVRRVSIKDSHFHDSRVVDDMLHAVYSEVEIARSRFENALLDAIDFDVVDGVISECVFIGAGNDNLDLMTSNVVVLDSEFHGAGDKGISVGEGTQLVAINNLLAGNQVGIEIKDGSIAHVLNATFRGNPLALHADSKNWRYGRGGAARVQFSLFESGRSQGTELGKMRREQGITAGRKSRIHLQACDTPSLAMQKEIAAAPNVLLSSEAAGIDALPSFARRYASKVVAGRRAFKRHEH